MDELIEGFFKSFIVGVGLMAGALTAGSVFLMGFIWLGPLF